MANFNTALAKILKREGGYANDPNDKGGETYKGISRRANPDAKMWILIDNYKKECGGINADFKNKLAKDKNITNEVNNIYKTKYWNPFQLDKVLNQKVAEQIFDDAVNRGVGAACKLCCSLLGFPISTKPSSKLLSILQTL